MREILFRGQIRKNGEKVRMSGEKVPGNWVFGGTLQGVGDHSIIYGGQNTEDTSEGFNKWCVHTDTIGQYTGQHDINNRMAFEHDIIKHHFGNEIGVIRYGSYRNPFMDDEFGGHVGFYVDWITGDAPQILRKDLDYWLKIVGIIGNIHDNPELLEV